MEKEKIIQFFDSLAMNWDEESIQEESIVQQILDYGGIEKDKTILDVACGTGVLFDFYLQRKVAKVVGIDISKEMVKIARKKYPKIQIICADVTEYQFVESFDCIMVFNAFPHFSNSTKLFQSLEKILKPKGRITIAHGSSREEINFHHHGSARSVSLDLPPAEVLAEEMACWFAIDTVISDNEKYVISGMKKQPV